MEFFNRPQPQTKEAPAADQYSQAAADEEALISEFMDTETREAIERNGGGVWVVSLEKEEIGIKPPDDATEGRNGTYWFSDGTGIHITASGQVFLMDKKRAR